MTGALGPVVLIFQSDLDPGCQGSVDALIHTGATDPELMADGGNWTTVSILEQQLGGLNLPDWSGPGAEGNPASDYVAVAEGYVSLTPLRTDRTNYDLAETMANWPASLFKEAIPLTQ